jgi:hypothetical protein
LIAAPIRTSRLDDFIESSSWSSRVVGDDLGLTRSAIALRVGA